MKAYKIKGNFQMGDFRQPFRKEVVGTDENNARDNLFSILGSKHRVKRPKIWIEKVTEIPVADVEDLVVKYRVEKGSD